MPEPNGQLKITATPELLEQLRTSGIEIDRLKRIVAAYKAEGYPVEDVEKMLSALETTRDLTLKAFK